MFLNRFGLCPATSGNLSRRLEEQFVAVTASGKHKGELTTEDVLIVDLRGCLQVDNELYSRLFCSKRHDRQGDNIEFNMAPLPIVSLGTKELESNPLSPCKHPLNGKALDNTEKPSAETALHIAIYALFKDVGAVLHTHSLNGIVLTRILPTEKMLVTKGYEIHKVFPDIRTHDSRLEIPIFENSQDMAAMATEVTAYLQEHPHVYGFLIRGHGFYTWGRDMKEAKIRIETFEHLFEPISLFEKLPFESFFTSFRWAAQVYFLKYALRRPSKIYKKIFQKSFFSNSEIGS